MELNAIGIACSDVAASLAFYRMLGVDLPEFDPDTGHYDTDLSGGIRLMLDSEAVMASFIDDYTRPTGNDRITLAVEYDTPVGVDVAFAQLVAAGHDAVREPFDAFWGQRYATVADPDGNHVDLYATP
jgi:uncharacterized glyoxalase superfamily protein PhnB